MSDHGTNFVGADQELKNLTNFSTEKENAGNCWQFLFVSSNSMEISFLNGDLTLEESGKDAVKTLKIILKKAIGNVPLNFEEQTTILTQVEACLNSRPLTPIPSEDDGIEVLTPGHFLIGHLLEVIPD